MEHANYLKEVRAQYEELPYPPCDPEQDKSELALTVCTSLDVLNHYGFEGKQDFKGFRTLVAGAGTGDAVIVLAEQLRDCGGEVVYLDMSAASLAIAKKRAAIRKLDNITWIHNSLLELPSMPDIGTFDYIDCVGVLHHLENPSAGLAALNSVLKDDGVMGLMVYGAYPRQCVYQMQDILRRLTAGETSKAVKIDTARKMLKVVEKSQWAALFNNPSADHNLRGDAGLYDLLLHSQDRAYTVPEVYDFIAEQGLVLRQFLGKPPGTAKIQYSPFHVTHTSLHEKIKAMPLREQQALAELIRGNMTMHAWYASRKPVVLPDPEDKTMIPFLSQKFIYSFGGKGYAEAHGAFAHKVKEHAGKQMEIVFGAIKFTVKISGHAAAMLHHMDGTRSIQTLCELARETLGSEAPDVETLHRVFIKIYTALHNFEIILLRTSNAKRCATAAELQQRVTEMYV